MKPTVILLITTITISPGHALTIGHMACPVILFQFPHSPLALTKYQHGLYPKQTFNLTFNCSIFTVTDLLLLLNSLTLRAIQVSSILFFIVHIHCFAYLLGL